MRKLFCVLVATMALVGCGMSNEEIGSTVQLSMQQKLMPTRSSRPYAFQVGAVQVLKQGENQYQGLAKIKYSGETHDVPLQITVDGKNVMWTSQPGAFMFVAQKEFQKLFNPQ